MSGRRCPAGQREFRAAGQDWLKKDDSRDQGPMLRFLEHFRQKNGEKMAFLI
jgi:hypothetical protein